MTGYLLDTNVISETRRVKANTKVTAFIASAAATGLFVSALTVGELWKGVALKQRTDKLAAAQLAGWVQGIETAFGSQVLPVDAAVARIWGELCAARSLPVIDTVIAATALAHSLILVTRNGKDFAATAVTVAARPAGHRHRARWVFTQLLIQPLREAAKLIRLARGLVPADAVDAWKAQRHAGLMPRGTVYGRLFIHASIAYSDSLKIGVCCVRGLRICQYNFKLQPAASVVFFRTERFIVYHLSKGHTAGRKIKGINCLMTCYPLTPQP